MGGTSAPGVMPTMLKKLVGRFPQLVVAMALLLYAAPALAFQCAWIQRDVVGPPARHSPGIAHDSRREVTVLFGGITGRTRGAQLYGDTWEWDGEAWTLAATTGPSPRLGHAMVYDEKRGVVVLFGGNDGSFRNETWEWDGQAWNLVATTGPSPRSRFGMAYDPKREVVVLFGGIPRDMDDTWEWDGTEWKQVDAEGGPSGRSRLPLVYDPNRETVVLFGGRLEDGQPTGDAWEWNGSTWTQLTETGDHARARHGMVFDPGFGALVAGGVVFGGRPDIVALIDGQWESAEGLDSTVGEAGSGAIGGEAGSESSAQSTGSEQSERSRGSQSSGRARGADQDGGSGASEPNEEAGALEQGDQGGASEPAERARGSGSQERAAGSRSRERETALGPASRVYYGMVYEAARETTLVFGGWDGDSPLGDTWELRCE